MFNANTLFGSDTKLMTHPEVIGLYTIPEAEMLKRLIVKSFVLLKYRIDHGHHESPYDGVGLGLLL